MRGDSSLGFVFLDPSLLLSGGAIRVLFFVCFVVLGFFEKSGFCFVVGLSVERVLFLQERSRRGEERRGEFEEGDWVRGE